MRTNPTACWIAILVAAVLLLQPARADDEPGQTSLAAEAVVALQQKDLTPERVAELAAAVSKENDAKILQALIDATFEDAAARKAHVLALEPLLGRPEAAHAAARRLCLYLLDPVRVNAVRARQVLCRALERGERNVPAYVVLMGLQEVMRPRVDPAPEHAGSNLLLVTTAIQDEQDRLRGIVDGLRAENRSIRLAFVRLIDREPELLQHWEVIEPLRLALQEEENDETALRLLATIGRSQSQEALLICADALVSPEAPVRDAAVEALVLVTGLDLPRNPLVWLDWCQENL